MILPGYTNFSQKKKKKKKKDKKKRWIERISACSYLYIDCGLTYVSQSRCAITKKKKEQVRNIA